MICTYNIDYSLTRDNKVFIRNSLHDVVYGCDIDDIAKKVVDELVYDLKRLNIHNLERDFFAFYLLEDRDDTFLNISLTEIVSHIDANKVYTRDDAVVSNNYGLTKYEDWKNSIMSYNYDVKLLSRDKYFITRYITRYDPSIDDCRKEWYRCEKVDEIPGMYNKVIEPLLSHSIVRYKADNSTLFFVDSEQLTYNLEHELFPNLVDLYVIDGNKCSFAYEDVHPTDLVPIRKSTFQEEELYRKYCNTDDYEDEDDEEF